jgi:hypothetical protein
MKQWTSKKKDGNALLRARQTAMPDLAVRREEGK